jgi:rhodanese-related sulfurtransferase
MKGMTMNKVIYMMALALALPAHAGFAPQNTEKAAQYFQDELNYKTNAYGVKKAIDNKATDVTIVDVRLAKDFAKGHIPGAINLPYDQYATFEGTEPEFPGLRKDGYNYVYCYTADCNLAQKAARKFALLGYPVKEVVGGFAAWRDYKYPVER